MEPTAPSLTEEDLTEVKKDALENLRVYLCEKIIAERHFDHLRAKKILSREDTEEISCRTSSRKRAGKLLDYLQENPKGLDTLVESIRREKTQNFLIQKITDEVLKLRNIKLEHLKERETEHERGKGRERGRHRIGNRLQALSHQPRARRGARTHRP
uniref:CARD domain-containing protein n=1 Tax=Felis catus TaxID=9685 RepID=A0ABI7YQP8_FELCA